MNLLVLTGYSFGETPKLNYRAEVDYQSDGSGETFTSGTHHGDRMIAKMGYNIDPCFQLMLTTPDAILNTPYITAAASEVSNLTGLSKINIIGRMSAGTGSGPGAQTYSAGLDDFIYETRDYKVCATVETKINGTRLNFDSCIPIGKSFLSDSGKYFNAEKCVLDEGVLLSLFIDLKNQSQEQIDAQRSITR